MLQLFRSFFSSANKRMKPTHGLCATTESLPERIVPAATAPNYSLGVASVVHENPQTAIPEDVWIQIATGFLETTRSGKIQFRGLDVNGSEGLSVRLRMPDYGNFPAVEGVIGVSGHLDLHVLGKRVPVATRKAPAIFSVEVMDRSNVDVEDGFFEVTDALFRRGRKLTTTKTPVFSDGGVRLNFLADRDEGSTGPWDGGDTDVTTDSLVLVVTQPATLLRLDAEFPPALAGQIITLKKGTMTWTSTIDGGGACSFHLNLTLASGSHTFTLDSRVQNVLLTYERPGTVYVDPFSFTLDGWELNI